MYAIKSGTFCYWLYTCKLLGDYLGISVKTLEISSWLGIIPGQFEAVQLSLEHPIGLLVIDFFFFFFNTSAREHPVKQTLETFGLITRNNIEIFRKQQCAQIFVKFYLLLI